MWKSRCEVLLALLAVLALGVPTPVRACSNDGECDNGDTCSVPDQCQSGSCVLGGGGDTDGNLICDAEFDPNVNIRVTKLNVTTSPDGSTGTGTIRGAGDFIDVTPPGPFSGNQGISIRMIDQLSLTPPSGDGIDVTVVFDASDCTTTATVVTCAFVGGSGRGSRVRFKRNHLAPEQVKFSYRLRDLPLARPFFGPMKVIVTDDTTVHREGQIVDCRLFTTGMRCREF